MADLKDSSYAAASADKLPKTYDPASVEDKIYAEWEASGAFNPDTLPARNQSGEPFCVMMPPPNRTGTLHIGHAMGLAIQDLLTRFERMRGKRALWVPGTDHAAIATQVKVEQMLIQEGMKDPRKELGREKFLERVVKFADESRNTIVNQTRKMGASCDWSRERYTLDADRNRAVNAVFKMMYDDGLIERGFRIVNWDPQFQTTLSDDEVETKETAARLVTFKYDKDFPIFISTTRLETKFGDTAVAVHPKDKRYKKLVGKTFQATFCGKPISVKIVADEAVDMEFGTGALGVTPAHSMIDAEIAERHSLPTVQVIDERGCMMADAGPDFAGLPVVEARKKAEAMLADAGLIESVQEITQALPVAQRGGAVVEQLPSKQWFVRVNKKFKKHGKETTLKELMLQAVESGQTNIVPERFEKVYFHWINNLRDWCISRQIWFGHRIPVWYRTVGADQCVGPEGGRTHGSAPTEMVVSDVSPGAGWEQDPDTLDTWFSSGLWTFSALGWPDEQEWEKMRGFHPTSVLETGRDIIFFWVARMVLMSTYVLGEVPFKQTYLHGLVMDEQGRKMSKSLGNVLDPLELGGKYGTDAVRLSLLIGTSPGQDTKLSDQKIAGYRNFTNKLWNISRFILTTIGTDSNPFPTKTLADEWILARLSETVASVTKKIEAFQFSAAGEELRDFTWGDLADWYLEIAKVEKGKTEILKTILQTVLKLWHPFMPFVTEYIWSVAGWDGKLIVSEWPTAGTIHELSLPSGFESLRTLVTDLRRLRAEHGVEAAKQVEFALDADLEVEELVGDNLEWIKRLTNAADLKAVETIPDGWVTASSGTVTIGLNIAGAIDLAKERAKIEKELEDLKKYVASTQAKLKNKEFASKAPEQVVAGMREKMEEAKAKGKALEARLLSLDG